MAEQGYMMKPLEVFAIDGKMNRCTGSIPYTSLQWNRKYYECGDFSMTVPASIYDPAWRYIETDERPETGIVQKVQYTDDPTYGNDDTVTISGFFLESIMNRRTFLDETPEEVTRRYYVHPPEPPQTEASIRDVYKDATGKYWYVTPSGKTYGVTEGTPTDSDARTPGSEVKTDESGQAYIETGAGRVDVEKEVVYKSLNSYYYNDGSTTEVHQVYYTMDDEGVIQSTADLTHGIAFNDGFGTTYFKDGDRLCAATGVTTKEGDNYVVQKSEWRRGTDLGWVEYTETVAGPWQITDVEDVTTEQDNVLRCWNWARTMFQNQMLFVVPTIAGESKIIDPSFKLLGDMMHEELKTVGATFGVEYDFQNNQFTFRVWRGLDRTQGANSPETAGAKRLAAPVARAAVQRSASVPSGYTQLEYIESTGTQYIDTGVAPNGKTRVVCDFQLTKVNPGFAGVFGSRGVAPGYNDRFVLWSASDTWRDDYNDSNVKFGAADTNRHSVDKNANITMFDEVSVATHAESSFSGNFPIYAFCANTGGSISQNKTSMRMWSCKIYTGDTLERDYAPCRRDSDGEIGLFDKVSQTFFANAGTGDFIAGPEVRINGELTYASNSATATGTTAPTEGFVGDSVIVAENGFYNPQRTFVSWNTSPTGDGTTYQPGEQYTLTGGDDVLYAQWARIPDALSYLPNNDNASGATQPTQGNVGDVVIVSSCGFSVSGAAFSGWNTKPDGSGVPYQPGDSYALTSVADVLYAQWIEIQPPSRKAPWAVFSDTWGTLYGYEAQRDDSNYRNTCHVLYEYDKPNSFDENGAPLLSKVEGYFEYTDDGPVWQPYFQGWQIDYQRMRGFSTVRLEDDYDDRETYIDLREDKPECDEEWSREIYPAEDYPEDSPPELPSGMKEEYDAFEASLLAQGRSKLENDYPIVTSLETGDLRTDRYMVDYDLGDLVDMAVNRLGIVEEARIVGASEVHESGSSTVDIEIGEQAISITKKARLTT